MMLVGAMGMKIVPAEYFGVVERFSVFAATGFNAALGIHLFCRKSNSGRLTRILSENTGRPFAQVATDTERDNYMSAEEALAYGLIDKIIDKK